MTPLLAFWLVSLVLLAGIIMYAHRKDRNAPVPLGEMPENFADFIAIELTRMTGHLSRGATNLRPHGEKVIVHGSLLLKKGHDIFIEKIFGRLNVEKGNVTSFFLKRIVEHKEELRQKDRKEIE